MLKNKNRLIARIGNGFVKLLFEPYAGFQIGLNLIVVRNGDKVIAVDNIVIVERAYVLFKNSCALGSVLAAVHIILMIAGADDALSSCPEIFLAGFVERLILFGCALVCEIPGNGKGVKTFIAVIAFGIGIRSLNCGGKSLPGNINLFEIFLVFLACFLSLCFKLVVVFKVNIAANRKTQNRLKVLRRYGKLMRFCSDCQNGKNGQKR